MMLFSKNVNRHYTLFVVVSICYEHICNQFLMKFSALPVLPNLEYKSMIGA